MNLKKNKKMRIPILAWVAAMLLALAPMSAFAHYKINSGDFGADVSGIAITGADVVSYTLTQSTFTYGSYTDNNVYTYDIVLSGNTASTETVTATITKAGSAGSACFISPYPPGAPPFYIVRAQTPNSSATLSNWEGTSTHYVHHDLGGAYGDADRYVFNYTTSDWNNPVTDSTTGLTFRFGDPDYPATPPESYMELEQRTDGYYNAVYTNGTSTYYPDILAFFITESDGSTLNVTSMTSNSLSNVAFREYSGGTYTDYASPTNEDAGFYTVKINSADYITITANGGTTRIYFSNPNSPTAGGGANPTSIRSYLPIGQFASGSGWGDSTGKFTGGYSATGVSLGALGGYIEFYFQNAIIDSALNPYGVDFIVYGNAFNGNPEAGAVQVSHDGVTWYELAGSLYYEGYPFQFFSSRISGNKYPHVYEGSLRDTSVTYDLGVSDIDVTLGSYGPYTFTAATSWYPDTADYPMAGSHVNTGANVTVSHTSSALSFDGITAIEDFGNNATYGFGYVDITPNGSSYGTAVNPYETYTSGKTGGDGFDLSWAVNISTGLPVDLSSTDIHYVRVYTAVLDNGFFGETSTEVCGIYVTDNPATSSVGTTTPPTVVISDGLQRYNNTPTYGNVEELGVTAGAPITITVNTSSGNYTYINGSAYTGASNVFTLSNGLGSGVSQTIRVVVQDGTTSEAFITYFKLTGA